MYILMDQTSVCLFVCLLVHKLLQHNQELNNQTWHTDTSPATEGSYQYYIYDVILLPSNHLPMGSNE